LIQTSAWASSEPQALKSAARYPGESFHDALRRHRRLLKKLRPDIYFSDSETVLKSAVPLKQADFSKVTVWDSKDKIMEMFKRVRDERFMNDPSHNGFARRSTWFYPQDGCWARAALAGMRIQKWGVARPTKLFIFGPLEVTTKNSPDGNVRWWYHVAPLVSDSQHNLFILDPAIEPKHPIAFHDWVLTMVKDPSQVRVGVCNPYAFAPMSPCQDSSNADEQNALRDQNAYLDSEWQNLVQLHRDPVVELGDSPVWLHHR
jgi:hypothetical protein